MLNDFNIVSCSSFTEEGAIKDRIRIAPCPPPMFPYTDFRNHALNNSLVMKEICLIARRCYINSVVMENDCPIEKRNCTVMSNSTSADVVHTTYISAASVITRNIVTVIIALIVLSILIIM